MSAMVRVVQADGDHLFINPTFVVSVVQYSGEAACTVTLNQGRTHELHCSADEFLAADGLAISEVEIDS